MLTESNPNVDATPANAPSRRLQLASLLLGGVALSTVGVGSSVASALVGDAVLPFLVATGTWALAAYKGAFHLHITRDDLHIVPTVIQSSAIATMLTATMALAMQSPLPWLSIAVSGATVSLALLSGVLLGRHVLRMLWRRGEFRTTAIVVGSGTLTRELVLELQHRPELGIDVLDHIELSAEPSSASGDGDRRSATEVERLLRSARPDRLIVGESSASDVAMLRALRTAGTLGTRVYVLPRLFSMGLGNPLFSPDRLRGFPLLRVNRSVHPALSLAAKRAIDVIVALGALLLTSPLLIVASAMVKATSPGDLFFWQERIGRNGETIRIPKLRSMRASADSDTEWTADQRITPIGRFLRRSAIDELPQLWSIVRGDMSLVGPRPERPAFAKQFAAEHSEYNDRLRMRAGLTGLSQIAGLRGDTSIAERTKFDNLYIDQWSLGGDLVIMLRTVVAILRERVYAEEHLELEEALNEIHIDISDPTDRQHTTVPADAVGAQA